MPGFKSLQMHKTNQDATRRQNISDQQIKGGFLTQLFNKYVIVYDQPLFI